MRRTIIYQSLDEEKQRCYNAILKHQNRIKHYLELKYSEKDIETDKFVKSQINYHNEQLIRHQLLMSRLEDK
jgi:hypothetical protein